MLELLPAIDLRGGQCVRLKQGDYARETVYDASPAVMAQRWAACGATRLHLVDLDGAKQGRPVNVAALRDIVAAVSIPCELGGGLRDDAAVQQMLEDLRIDRVIIGTQALKQPVWFRKLVVKYPHRVALGLDARQGFVATEGWLDVSQVRARDLLQQFAELPVAAVIYTNIANDGMLQGVDDDTLTELEQMAAMGFPMIASGGVSTLDDVAKLVAIHNREPRLQGAIIGRALYEGTLDLRAALALTTASA
jgi:phosphoribosylformimino-5-aminoimidazole carboxamide ribotide isomerase